MYLAMLKKEFKQFFRSKGNVVLLFLFPVILITTLSLGLKDMMSGSADIYGGDSESTKAYYTITGDSNYKEGFMSFTKGVEESLSIKFEETSELDNVEEEVDNYKALVHIEVGSDGFKLYTSKKGEKIQGKVFRSIFDSMLNEYGTFETIGKYNPKAFSNLVQNKYDDYVVKEKLDGTRDVSAAEYYTFAELALIIFFIAQTVGESVYKETQLRTINRIRLSKVKENVMIGAKVSLGILIGIIQTILIYVYSSTVLDVDWGANTVKFILLFITFAIFSSVVGAIVGLCAKKDTSVGGSLSAVTFIICALGGCYTPLNMLVGIPLLNKLMYISPIYWINTATSSMICGLESKAYAIALIIPIVLSAVCLIAYLAIMKKGEGL